MATKQSEKQRSVKLPQKKPNPLLKQSNQETTRTPRQIDTPKIKLTKPVIKQFEDALKKKK